MGTKNDPGAFDCHAKAEPDEPLFTLLARDIDAPALVRDWATRKLHEGGSDTPIAKIREAFDLADAMEEWRRERGA